MAFELSLCDNLHRAFQSIGYAPGVRNRGECGIALTTTQTENLFLPGFLQGGPVHCFP